MSGGSYQYAYRGVDSLADDIEHNARGDHLRLAFAEHLRACAVAARAIEWVDSCDYAPGDEHQPIRACVSQGDCLRSALKQAHEARDALQQEIERATA